MDALAWFILWGCHSIFCFRHFRTRELVSWSKEVLQSAPSRPGKIFLLEAIGILSLCAWIVANKDFLEMVLWDIPLKIGISMMALWLGFEYWAITSSDALFWLVISGVRFGSAILLFAWKEVNGFVLQECETLEEFLFLTGIIFFASLNLFLGGHSLISNC